MRQLILNIITIYRAVLHFVAACCAGWQLKLMMDDKVDTYRLILEGKARHRRPSIVADEMRGTARHRTIDFNEPSLMSLRKQLVGRVDG